jgi:hypothetical protein
VQVNIEFYRIRASDDSHAALNRIMQIAPYRTIGVLHSDSVVPNNLTGC